MKDFCGIYRTNMLTSSCDATVRVSDCSENGIAKLVWSLTQFAIISCSLECKIRK